MWKSNIIFAPTKYP